MTNKVNVAVFASGNGSNTRRIAEYFSGDKYVSICLILTNKQDAYVIEHAKEMGIPYVVFSGRELKDECGVLKILKDNNINFIVLAGFLLLIPDLLVEAFPNKIINIHPALLPKYGGKGMYGMNVHSAVIAAREKESGISIHYVNHYYDEGQIIFQAKCDIAQNETPESLAKKIHSLEYEYYPKVIKNLLNS